MSRTNNLSNPALGLFWLFAGGALLLVLLLNLQPWWVIGGDFADQINIIPGLGLLEKHVLRGTISRVIGGLLAFYGFTQLQQRKVAHGFTMFIAGGIFLVGPGTVYENLGYVIGTILWGWVQLVQVAPMLVRWGYGNVEWLDDLRQYRIAAYVIELSACLYRFPPYADGNVTRFLNDLKALTLNPALWDWGNFFWAAACMVGVELTLIFLLKASWFAGAREATT